MTALVRQNVFCDNEITVGSVLRIVIYVQWQSKATDVVISPTN